MTEPRPNSESELVEYLRSIDVQAPEELHRRIETLVAERTGPRRRPLRARSLGRAATVGGWLAAGLALAAVVAVALVVSLAGGGSGSLSLRQTSALALRAATMPAPAEDPHNGAQLEAAVEGVAFPYWGGRLGWHSTGSRTDRIGGRTVTTVFYANGRGQRIGYAIVAGTPAPRASSGVVVWRGGASYRLLLTGGARVVTWMRDGHLCVVAGRGVDGATLLALASWHERGTLAA